MALATLSDYQTLTGTTVAAGDQARVTALLAYAEAAVRQATDQAIEQASYTDITLGVVDGYAYFPQRPVSAVSSVVVNDIELTEGTDYRWTTGGKGRPALLVRRVNEFDSSWTGGDLIVVSYTAGWSTIPKQLTAVVVQAAHGVVTNGMNRQPNQQATGPFSASFPESESTSPTFDLSESALSVVHDICGVRAPGSVHIHRG